MKYGLTKKGKESVKREAEKYSDFDVIFSSPFRRTQETATYFAHTSQCEIFLDKRLVDIDLGEFDQSPYETSNLKAKDRDNDYVYPNGESLTQTLKRMIDFISEINSKYEHKKILIVSHGTPCETLLDWVEGKPLRTWETCIERGKVFPVNT